MIAEIPVGWSQEVPFGAVNLIGSAIMITTMMKMSRNSNDIFTVRWVFSWGGFAR